jgi:hypothetical protein
VVMMKDELEKSRTSAKCFIGFKLKRYWNQFSIKCEKLIVFSKQPSDPEKQPYS